jgi:hypothetical protein
MDTSKGGHMTFGHYGCCTTSGCVHPREPCYYYQEKSAGKIRACAEPTSGQGHLRTGPLPVMWLCHFRSKGEEEEEEYNHSLFPPTEWPVKCDCCVYEYINRKTGGVTLQCIGTDKINTEGWPRGTLGRGVAPLKYDGWIFFKFYIHLSNHIGGVIGSPCCGGFDLRWGQNKNLYLLSLH